MKKIILLALILIAVWVLYLRWWAVLYVMAAVVESKKLPDSFDEWKEIFLWLLNPEHT